MIDTDMYDFIINDEEEVMLLLYERQTAPDNATFEIDFKTQKGTLKRNQQVSIDIEDIPQNVLDSLSDADNLLVCEMSIEENEEKTQIVYAYEAEIID